MVRLDHVAGLSLITPEPQLQPKGDRYYFINTWAKAEGQVYISPLDLNIENGKVDLPYLPMIRFGAPIFDDNGSKQGAVILNMKGQGLLDTFDLSMAGGYPAFLLNGDAGDEGVVVSFQDFSEIKNYQEEIHLLAYQDILTGLPNRRVLEDRLPLAAAPI